MNLCTACPCHTLRPFPQPCEPLPITLTLRSTVSLVPGEAAGPGPPKADEPLLTSV